MPLFSDNRGDWSEQMKGLLALRLIPPRHNSRLGDAVAGLWKDSQGLWNPLSPGFNYPQAHVSFKHSLVHDSRLGLSIGYGKRWLWHFKKPVNVDFIWLPQSMTQYITCQAFFIIKITTAGVIISVKYT